MKTYILTTTLLLVLFSTTLFGQTNNDIVNNGNTKFKYMHLDLARIDGNDWKWL